MLIGLHELAKVGKLLKIVTNRRLPNIYYSRFGIVKGRHLTFFFTNLIKLKLISDLVSSGNTVFLCINATQV